MQLTVRTDPKICRARRARSSGPGSTIEEGCEGGPLVDAAYWAKLASERILYIRGSPRIVYYSRNCERPGANAPLIFSRIIPAASIFVLLLWQMSCSR